MRGSKVTSGKPLNATFVRTVTRPGSYGDGRGGHGLILRVKTMKERPHRPAMGAEGPHRRAAYPPGHRFLPDDHAGRSPPPGSPQRPGDQGRT